MSGDLALRPPQSLDTNCSVYEDLIDQFGLKNLSQEDQITHLKAVPWEDLVSNKLNGRLFPTISGGFVATDGRFNASRSDFRKISNWCNGLMLGDCRHDVCV